MAVSRCIIGAAVLAAVFSSAAASALHHHHNDDPITADDDMGPSSLRWFAIGDWGGAGSSDHTHQLHVAEQMSKTAATFKPNFVINVGDNFYESGVTSVTDSQWQSKYEQVYFSTPEEKVDWWSVLGNHDYISNPQAEVEYSQQHLGSDTWKMPSRYYTQTFEFSDITAQFVFIDTIMLSSATTLRVAREELSEGIITQDHYDRLASFIARDQVATNNGTIQLEWIEQTLAASTADWLFVVGHFPVYSGGSHGNTPELQEQVLPLLIKYNVDAYLDGHDHTLQALYSDNVYYYVTGAGCQHESHDPKTLPQTLYGTSKVHGFATMAINATTFEIVYLSDHGEVMYQDRHAVRPKSAL